MRSAVGQPGVAFLSDVNNKKLQFEMKGKLK